MTDSLSYSLGVLIGQNLQAQGFADLNADVLGDAINDVLRGEASIDVEKANTIVQREAQRAAKEKHAGVHQAGLDFLAENKKREGVTTLPSGLQYEVLKQGDGAVPAATDHVVTHYHGMLIDGQVFDSSVDRGEPASFPVKGVIEGWQEVLQLMPVGSKWKVFIPQELAYGERGAGANIPPFSALIFEIELISIQ